MGVAEVRVAEVGVAKVDVAEGGWQKTAAKKEVAEKR